MALFKMALLRIALLRIALLRIALLRIAFEEACGAAVAADAAGAVRLTAARLAAATAAAVLTRIRDISAPRDSSGGVRNSYLRHKQDVDSHYGPFFLARFGNFISHNQKIDTLRLGLLAGPSTLRGLTSGHQPD